MKCYLTRSSCGASDAGFYDDGDSCPLQAYRNSNRATPEGRIFDSTCRYYGIQRAKELITTIEEGETMAKKDFSQVNTGRVYGAIAEATAEPEPAAEINPAAAQETAQERKPRRTYTEQEAAEIMQTLQTSGRKGIKLPRINLAFTPELHEYIITMSRVRGENLTQFVNYVLRQHMEEHRDIYEKAIEFRNSL